MTTTTSPTFGQRAGRLTVGAVIPVLGLFILRLLLASLAMIRDASPIGDTGITPVLLVKAVIDSLIYFLIFRFCLSISRLIRTLRPRLAELATVVMLAGAALILTLAYSGYEQLILTIAGRGTEVYNWFFLIAVLLPIVGIAVIVTRRLEFFTDLVFKQFGAISHSGSSASEPPEAPPPGSDSEAELESSRKRFEQVADLVTRAHTLLSDGGSSAASNETSAKMDAYLDSAKQSLEKLDFARSRHCLDWAEFEAKRMLAGAEGKAG